MGVPQNHPNYWLDYYHQWEAFFCLGYPYLFIRKLRKPPRVSFTNASQKGQWEPRLTQGAQLRCLDQTAAIRIVLCEPGTGGNLDWLAVFQKPGDHEMLLDITRL